jgi:hypothetical protein
VNVDGVEMQGLRQIDGLGDRVLCGFPHHHSEPDHTDD